MPDKISRITPDQCRAARGLLGWSQSKLAEETGLNITTISEFERDGSRTTAGNVNVLRMTMERAGVQFIEPNGGGAGVRWKDNRG